MKIILSGGGTIGSVSPLLAIYEEIKWQKPDTEFLWVATNNGTEHKLVDSYRILIRSIFSGKFRRYFSLKNFLDPIFILFGFFQSLGIIFKFKPDFVLSAGGFVSVPLVWAAGLLGKPVLIHQQDVQPGLANKMMAPFARIITVAFEKSVSNFPAKKTFVVGNPVRRDISAGSREEAYNFFKFSPRLPTILVMGGGTGARTLNKIVLDSLSELVKFCQVIHLTGGRVDQVAEHSHYRSYDFFTNQIKDAYAVADLVISRAGMSSLSEIAALKKPAIIIPIPQSHQEKNALEFFKNNAIVLVQEENLDAKSFPEAVKELLVDKVELANLSRNVGKVMPINATERVVKIIFKFHGI